MQIQQICVLGGSGFVGSALVHKLSNAGYRVKVLTRRRETAKHLILLPEVQVEECDIWQPQALHAALRGSDAVVNLLGILHESDKISFQQVHADFAKTVAQACQQLGIKRLMHMSALQATEDAPSAYLRSKALGEANVLVYAQDVHITIFQPSVIFGRGDSFLNLFANLVRVLPVVVLAKPDAKFQPVWVENVADAMVLALNDVNTYGQRYQLGGPRIYSLKQLVEFVMFVLGKKRLIVGLNNALSYYQAYAMEFLPVKLMSRDNIYSMQVDSVCSQEFPFGIQPSAMEAIVPEYLANDTPRASYDKFRSLAGR